jgi:hypothetical protein
MRSLQHHNYTTAAAAAADIAAALHSQAPMPCHVNSKCAGRTCTCLQENQPCDANCDCGCGGDGCTNISMGCSCDKSKTSAPFEGPATLCNVCGVWRHHCGPELAAKIQALGDLDKFTCPECEQGAKGRDGTTKVCRNPHDLCLLFGCKRTLTSYSQRGEKRKQTQVTSTSIQYLSIIDAPNEYARPRQRPQPRTRRSRRNSTGAR